MDSSLQTRREALSAVDGVEFVLRLSQGRFVTDYGKADGIPYFTLGIVVCVFSISSGRFSNYRRPQVVNSAISD